MIIEIKETTYRGFHIKHVENKGWKIIIGDEEFLFQNLQAAQKAIDEILNDFRKKL